MCKICKKEYDSKTEKLECVNCLELEEIPSELSRLEHLVCINCKYLKKIPDTITLKELWVGNCDKLKIPDNLQHVKTCETARSYFDIFVDGHMMELLQSVN